MKNLSAVKYIIPNSSLPAAEGGMPESYKDEWDLLITEFGLDSEEMPLPMSRAEIKKRLLARHTAVAAGDDNELLV